MSFPSRTAGYQEPGEEAVLTADGAYGLQGGFVVGLLGNREQGGFPIEDFGNDREKGKWLLLCEF